MDHFKLIIDNYLTNYEQFQNGKIEFECKYGELIFIKNQKSPNTLIMYGIYINPEYRGKGLCRNILHYLIDKSISRFKYISIQSVLSNIFYNYLLRFAYKNKKFKRNIDGFVYKL